MVGIDDPKDETEWNEQPDHSDAEPLETEQLALSDEEERLPWLESSDDDNFDDDAGTDWGHTLRLGLLAVVALGALVGGIYWTTHRNSDPVLVADGSLVQPTVSPTKKRPRTRAARPLMVPATPALPCLRAKISPPKSRRVLLRLQP